MCVHFCKTAKWYWIKLAEDQDIGGDEREPNTTLVANGWLINSEPNLHRRRSEWRNSGSTDLSRFCLQDLASVSDPPSRPSSTPIWAGKSTVQLFQFRACHHRNKWRSPSAAGRAFWRAESKLKEQSIRSNSKSVRNHIKSQSSRRTKSSNNNKSLFLQEQFLNLSRSNQSHRSSSKK